MSAMCCNFVVWQMEWLSQCLLAATESVDPEIQKCSHASSKMEGQTHAAKTIHCSSSLYWKTSQNYITQLQSLTEVQGVFQRFFIYYWLSFSIAKASKSTLLCRVFGCCPKCDYDGDILISDFVFARMCLVQVLPCISASSRRYDRVAPRSCLEDVFDRLEKFQWFCF